MQIRHLTRDEIDKTKWNSCVHYANNGNVTGYMWYLDQVNKEWEALIEGDYESVMPLIWRQGRFGGRELYQPELISNVGIYSINVLTPKRIQAFLAAIPDTFSNINILLNEKTYLTGDLSFESQKEKRHYLLLNQPFELLYEVFTASLKEEVQKAETSNLVPDSNLKPEVIADFYKKHASSKKSLHFNFHALQRIMWNALHRGWGFPSAIINPEQEILAADFFIYSHGKVQSIMPSVSPSGKKQGALAYLFYTLLQKHANQPLILEFNKNTENNILSGLGAKTKSYNRVQKTKKKWLFF